MTDARRFVVIAVALACIGACKGPAQRPPVPIRLVQPDRSALFRGPVSAISVAGEDSQVWFFSKVLGGEEGATPASVFVAVNPFRIEIKPFSPAKGEGIYAPCMAWALEPTQVPAFSAKDIDLKYAEPSLSILGQPVRLAETYAERAEVLPGRRSAVIISAPDRRKAGGLIVDGGKITNLVMGTRVVQFYSIDGDLSDIPAYRLDGSAGCEAIRVYWSCEGRIVVLAGTDRDSRDNPDGPVLFWVLENPAYKPRTQTTGDPNLPVPRTRRVFASVRA